MAVLNGGYLVRLLFISLLDLVKKGTREMINKPAAWLVKNKDLGIGYMQTNEPTRMDKLANEYLPLYTHPAKELHLSLQKSKETGELLAVTYTDDEHRIVEVLWKKPPAKTLTDEEIWKLWQKHLSDDIPVFARAILRKAQEK